MIISREEVSRGFADGLILVVLAAGIQFLRQYVALVPDFLRVSLGPFSVPELLLHSGLPALYVIVVVGYHPKRAVIAGIVYSILPVVFSLVFETAFGALYPVGLALTFLRLLTLAVLGTLAASGILAVREAEQGQRTRAGL